MDPVPDGQHDEFGAHALTAVHIAHCSHSVPQSCAKLSKLEVCRNAFGELTATHLHFLCVV
jgi:hypothetical protein